MKKKIRVLSSKILEFNQKQMLLNAGFELVEKDFIQIQLLDFELKKQPELLLFTSQNAVKSVCKNPQYNKLIKVPAICVGIKTKELLEKQGFEVLDMASYAKDLSELLKEKYVHKYIAFFAGDKRRDTLPIAMKNAGISYEEYTVYKNTEMPQNIKQEVDAILFYSPSGVVSYMQNHTIAQQVCFCIGTTTASALKYTQNIEIAHEQTVESLLQKCIEYYNNNR